ncbi:MAG: topoisomerase, partial [Dehalococcoidia bacterium]|nr:topoisomerase [Dehalococcoidia bacterium]
AIRPTSIFREPEVAKSYLNNDQYRLYDLIWKRMVASQAAPQSIETTSVDIEANSSGPNGAYLLRATQSRTVFPGFTTIYKESSDEEEEEAKEGSLPALAGGDPLALLGLDPKQHFTQPPARFTDASLVKALEDNGIGRPSTYAAILSTILDRGYVERAERHLIPLEIGMIVNDLLTEHFPRVVDIGFTAQMEELLDDIADGKEDWIRVIGDFYSPFRQSVDDAMVNIERIELPVEPTGEPCELCGMPMLIRQGRFGKFVGCSGFPKCRNTKPILTTIGVKCPTCQGELVEKKTRKGRRRVFYGCANYPTCDFTSWERPLSEPCPHCGGILIKTNADSARCHRCEAVVDIESLKPVAAEVGA